MLSVDAALRLVIENAGRQPRVETPLLESLGLVLAEPVESDIDSPPFAKSLMDGFAVRNEDLQNGKAKLKVLGEITAGSQAQSSLESGTAYQIMTGAPLPAGADAVVMVERSTVEGEQVFLDDPGFRADQNVMPKGRELTAGQTVLKPGHRIGPAEVGLLASVGCIHPTTFRRPRAAILSTGDEIVAPDQTPGPAQIRNSNAYTLWALCQACGIEAIDLGIARDDPETIGARVGQGLQYDLLLLTGGVSAGNKDFVPQALASNGVEKVFHKVEFKPGKPVWFGRHERGLVFGLPGNPVAVLVCFQLFVATAIRARQGLDASLQWTPARLEADFAYPTRRETFHPARLRLEEGGYVVQPVPWFGSPDLRALTEANALLRLPATPSASHPRGAMLSTLPIASH